MKECAPIAQVPAIQPEQIESDKLLRRTPAEQVVELGLAVVVEMNDFAIEHSILDW